MGGLKPPSPSICAVPVFDQLHGVPKARNLVVPFTIEIHNPLFLFVWRLVLVVDAVVVVLISLDW